MVRTAVAVMLAAACGRHDREPAAPNRDGARDAPAAATRDAPAAAAGDAPRPRSGDAQSMIDLLHDVIRFAAAERLTVERAATQFGPVARDEGGDGPVHLTPRDPRLRAVAVTRRSDTGDPYTIELTLATPVPLADLQAAFRFREVRSDWQMPRELVAANLDGGDGPVSVALLVQVAKDLAPADATVGQLVVRTGLRTPAP